MRRLLWVACLFGAAGCNCGKPDGALKVVVKVDPTQRATCVVLDVSDGSAVLQSVELVRSSPTVAARDELVVGLKKGEFPSDVTFTARGFLASGAGTGCDTPRAGTGEGAGVAATFPASGVTTVEVTLPVPAANLDVDRDGYVGVANGGNDCNDAVAAINPGATEDCAGNVDQDCDGLAGCSDTGCATALICQRTPDRLVFVTGPVTIDARACSPAVSVEAQDAMGATVAQQGLPVALSATPSTGVTFYTDAACANAVTTVNINQGETRASFHFRATTGGTSFTATASVIGLTPATQLETITHPAPTQLAFSTPARTQAANACGQAMTVELRDGSGTATQAGTASTVVVAGAPATGLQFFSDSGCTSQLSGNSFGIPAGSSTGTFYARGTRAGAIALTASVTGLTPAQQTMTVTPLAATQLRFVSSAQGIATATCSAPVTLETQDVYGNASPVSAQTAVTLGAAPPTGFGFFTDAACNTSAGGTVNIAANQSQAVFYFRGATAGTVVMTASASVGSDTQNAGIGVGPPAKLTITTAPQTAVVAGTCSGAVTVQSRDISDNPSNITGSALAVVITPNPLNPIQLFSDAACSAGNLITGSSIPVGNTTATFYFRSTLAGVVNLAVSSTLATGDNQNETIVATTPTVIRFTSNPITTTSTTCAGPFNLEARDQYGNPSPVFSATAVTLAPAGVTFFAAAGCSGGSAVQFNASSSTTSFYARATAANTYLLDASAGGLGNDTQSFVVNPGPVDRLAFLPPTSNLVAGTCSGALTVQRQDAQGNAVTVGGQIAVALADDTTSPAFGFHLLADCSDVAVASVDILASASSATVYVTGQRAETVNLTASSGGIANNGTHAVTVGAAGLHTLVFNPTTSSVTAGVCTSGVTVQRRDQYGNLLTSGALQVNLSHNASGGTFEFFAGAGCTGGAVGNVTINDTQTQTTFSIRATRAELVNVTGTATGVTVNAALALTVDPAAADRLIFVPASGNLTAGTCSGAVTLERRDPFSNLVTSGALNVTLSENTSSTAFEFHAVAGCGDAASASTSIPDGSSSVQVFFAAQRAEVVNVGATGTGITTNGAYALTVDAASASQLVFTTTPISVAVGVCSAVLTVQRQDAFGNAVPVAGNTAVAFADDGVGFDFHLASDCSDGATTSGTMLGGASTSSFYVTSPNTDPQVTMTITVGALVATQDAAVTGQPQLVFTNAARAITGGQCTAVMNVQRQTSGGAPITGGGPLTVNLSSNATSNATGGLTFHTDAACATAAVTTTQIAGGSSTSTDFYVKANVAPENPLLTAAAGGFTSGTQTVTVTVGPAAKLRFSSPGPQTVAQLACSAMATVRVEDAGGNAVAGAGQPARVIGIAGTGGTNTTIHTSLANCNASTAVGTINMAINTSTITLFFKAESGASTTLTATDQSTALTAATELETLTPAAPARLFFPNGNQTAEAGFCQALVLERQDALNRATAPASATTVTGLSANNQPTAPRLASQFFSDNACTVALATPFDILANQSSTTVYFKGRSGTIPGANTTAANSQTITATAAGLTNGTVNVTVNPMVRRGTCTIENNETSSATSAAQCTVTPTLASIDRTLLVFQASANNGDEPQVDSVTCRLTPNAGAALIICERLGSSAAIDDVINVNWQLLSFPYSAANGGVTVQHLSTNMSAVGNFQDVTIANAPQASSFVIGSFRGNGTGNYDGTENFTWELTSATNLRISLASDAVFGTPNPTQVFESQVVTWANASVVRGLHAGGQGTASGTAPNQLFTYTASPASGVTARSFMLHSSRMATSAETGNDMCSRRLTGAVTDATTLTFRRACPVVPATPGDDIGGIAWERVEVPTGSVVHQVTGHINNNASAVNVTIPQVDRTRAVAFASGYGTGGLSGGRSPYSDSDRLGCSQVNIDFNSDVQIGLQRGTSNADCDAANNSDGQGDWNLFVVEVLP